MESEHYNNDNNTNKRKRKIVSEYENFTIYNKNVLKLYYFLNKIRFQDNKSNCIDPPSMINIFKLLYKGSAGQTKKILKSSELKSMIKYAPKSMYSRSGVFIRRGCKFNVNYVKKFEKNHIFDFIPEDEQSINRINKLVDEKFPNWYKEKDQEKINIFDKDKFFTNFITNYDLRLYIKDQSIFKDYWIFPFDSEHTEMSDFYIGNNEKITVQMMTIKCSSDEYILTYFNAELKCLFVSLPYCNGYSMLIAMPRDPPLCKTDLVELCSKELFAKTINEFYKIAKPVKYSQKYLPKFEFETKWELNSVHENLKNDDSKYYCPMFLRAIFNNNQIDLGNIYSKCSPTCNTELVRLVVSSAINNNEDGTYVQTQTEFEEEDFYDDDDDDDDEEKILKIENNFMFMIFHNRESIDKIGIFAG